MYTLISHGKLSTVGNLTYAPMLNLIIAISCFCFMNKFSKFHSEKAFNCYSVKAISGKLKLRQQNPFPENNFTPV